MRGRGLLGKWGPNHAADPIVSRYLKVFSPIKCFNYFRKEIFLIITSEYSRN